MQMMLPLELMGMVKRAGMGGMVEMVVISWSG